MEKILKYIGIEPHTLQLPVEEHLPSRREASPDPPCQVLHYDDDDEYAAQLVELRLEDGGGGEGHGDPKEGSHKGSLLEGPHK